ncbi:MAG: porin [Gammaproteobacteria bacterium]|nr:porin [Gammaproteobacteria bacterium]MCF6362532.1 porin [Gammaproteobacteria bacterium]
MVVWRRLAASVVLVFTPVVALSADVSVYGSANVELASYQDKRPESERQPDYQRLRVEDNTRGRFGIKAAEDLGGGMSSFARFEWELSTATNTSPNATEDTNASLTQRMSYVGLAGRFGSVLAGNLKSPYKYTGGVKYDPFVATALEARGNGGMTGGPFGHEDFLEKMIAYESPRGPVRGRIAYGFEQKDNALSLDLMFKRESWEVFVAYMDSGKRARLVDPADPASSQSFDYTAAKIGGQYRSENEAHRLSLQYEYIEDASDGTTSKPSLWFLGYQFTLGKMLLATQVGLSSGDALSTRKTRYATVGAIYKFSADTRVYTGYRFSKDLDAVFTLGLRKDFRS